MVESNDIEVLLADLLRSRPAVEEFEMKSVNETPYELLYRSHLSVEYRTSGDMKCYQHTESLCSERHSYAAKPKVPYDIDESATIE